jgi:predicted metal-dependent phosphotriesterase family hydrolase
MRIQTVGGPVAPEDLGPTLMHEHVLSLAPPRFFSGGRRDDAADLAERALGGLRDHGIGAVVNLTGRAQAAAGPDLETLRTVADQTGLAIVVGVSLYKEPFPVWVAAAGIDELAERFVAMAEAVGAGIFGEVGTGLDVITPDEEKSLRAAARAHLRTGLPISTHCTLGTMALEQVAILREEGADLSRTVIGHLDLKPDVDGIEAVLRTGATVAFDTFGKEWFDYEVPNSQGQGAGEFVKWAYHRSDRDRLAALVELLRRGWEAQLVVSSDISGREAYLNPDTHGRHGYAFIVERVLPALRTAGVVETAIRTMLVDNPARILALS